MNNFIYASDKNYNTQLFYSIISLLENITAEVNIFIIHKEPESFELFNRRIKSQYKNVVMNIYKFEFTGFNFPNIENKHVSEATYYRIFIDKFIPKEIKNYVYLDADIICINDPTKYIQILFDELSKENKIIGCRTENLLNEHSKEMFDNLSMKSPSYFNAGVMFVDHQKWISEDIGLKLLDKLEEIRDVINYWDQDVLNSVFDGNYKEVSNSLNFPINLRWPVDCKDVNERGSFLHYQSNNKPWSVRGCFNKGSQFYQDIALKTDNKYHIVRTVKRYDFFHLLVNTIKLNFNQLKKPLKFYRESIFMIFFEKSANK